jgi:FG-GAP-like repeat
VISIRLGRGDGTFTAAAPVQQSGGGIQTLAVADVNRDGILDLVFENGASHYLYIYAGQGDGTFSALPSPTLPAFADLLPGAAYADVNRDGNLDLVSTVSGVPGEGQTTIFTAFGKGNVNSMTATRRLWLTKPILEGRPSGISTEMESWTWWKKLGFST